MRALPAIEDLDDKDYYPIQSDAANFGTFADPYPFMDEKREQGSVQQGSYREMLGLTDLVMPNKPSFSVFGYDAVQRVLLDTANFSNKIYEFNLGIGFGKSITAMDRPEHGLYRPIFQKAFLPNRVKAWDKTIVAPVVDRIMSSFEKRGHADLVSEFAFRYPFEIIYAQLGLPQEDIAVFQKLALTQTDFARPEKVKEAGLKLGRYFQNILDLRRTEPGDDLVSMLANTEVDGKKLPDEIIVSFLRQLINAAGDTTYRSTCAMMVGLLENPDQLEAVRQDRSLVPAAVEEAIRWEGPVIMHARIAVNDVEIDGVTIPAGSPVSVVAGSANHDPSRFPEPHKFDIFRSRKVPHAGFTMGPHICVGQHLARIEMGRALNACLDRLPNLRLDPDKPHPQLRGCMLRVPEHIHVLFDPA